jgi:phage tail sheath protein FI
MATTYKTPGVYVEEISKFPPSVAQVETAIPAFIGYTEISDASVQNKPKRIVSLLEYETYFGKAQNEAAITVTINDTIDSGPPLKLTDQKFTVAMPSTSPFVMYYAMRMYFDNGGGPCYICSVGDYSGGSVSQVALVGGLNELEKFDEPTLYAFPDAMAVSTADSYYSLINKALSQAQKLKDRFVIIDAFANNSANIRSSSTLGNGVSLLKYGAAYHPFFKNSIQLCLCRFGSDASPQCY